MNAMTPFKFNRIACYAMLVLLSACGGGGSANQAATSAPAVATSPAALPVPAPAEAPALTPAATVAAELPLPPLSAAPAWAPYDELAARPGSPDVPEAQGTLVAPDPAYVTTTGGEAPYPDLRMLPTRIMPFEPVAFGDVSFVKVTSVR